MSQQSKILGQLLHAAAARNPEKIAFKSHSGQISYQELDQRTNQIGNWLISNNVKKGDRVGILIEKNLFIPYAIYGILKTGAVLVALDPSQAVEKLQTIIEECGISILISIPSHQRILDALESDELKVLGSKNGTSWEAIFKSENREDIQVTIAPTDFAYILYTSGSTGEPKGIIHTHASGFAYAKQSAELYDVAPKDVVGNVASLHFDQSTFGYFSALYAQCTTYIFSQGELVMLGSFCDAVRQNEISILYSVPSLFISLIKGNFDLNFPTLRWIKYGGESFPIEKLKLLQIKTPKVQISNVYGPAEVNQCTFYTIPVPLDIKQEIPIGQVWANTDYLILDENDEPVSDEGKGELLIHSVTMMHGYWNNEPLNKQSFYNFTQDGKRKRFYRTGDHVYLNDRKELVFIGRMDRQVKIRGYRIELGAIEKVLMGLSIVQDAAAFTTLLDGEKELCAAIVPTQSPLDSKALITDLKNLLPSHSIPKHLFEVPSLPHSDNGKVHYKKLEKQFSN